jgi:hypothetical protein
MDGSRVVIIGGVREAQLQLFRLLLERQKFADERHHNQCAVCFHHRSLTLGKKVMCPFLTISAAINGYILHTDRRVVTLDGDADPSLALRRVQFDASCSNRTAAGLMLSARATDLEFHDDRLVIYTESEPLEADVVVGAFGLDEGTAAIFTRTVDYRSPPALAQ